jgi:alpha-tubulin suppressor-like RCC1 family protein
MEIKPLLLLFSIFVNSTFRASAQSDWHLVSGGNGHTVAIKKDGTLWGWGGANVGQLGDGTNKNKNYPVKISSDTNWLRIEAGIAHSIALKSDGTLWGWGYSKEGRVGTAKGITGGMILQPTQLGTDTDWKTFSAGGEHTLAIKNNGSLWAWGSNEFGQLGTNTISGYTVNLTRIGNDSNWMAVSAGNYFSMGLKNDGTLWTWGFNRWYQLGDSTSIDKNKPVKIGRDSTWIQIAAGGENGHAIKSDGTLWAWGYNNYGSLGDSSTVDKKVPTQIGNETSWKSISKGDGGGFTIAIKSDSSIWTWGYNNWGQLGNGTLNNKIYPEKILTQKKWQTVSAGGGHALAIDINGSMWAWGENSYGQLGDATNINTKTEVAVNSCPSTFTTIIAGTNFSFKANLKGLSDYNWDFGDGSLSALDSGNHIYARSGTYNVCLTVHCSAADSSKTCASVTLKSKNCKAQFSAPADTADKFKFNFINYSIPSSSINNWKFGDGNTSADINPTHKFAIDKKYTVCLFITDTASICTDSLCKIISISKSGCDSSYTISTNADTLFYNYEKVATSVKWEISNEVISVQKKGFYVMSDYGIKNLCLIATCSNSESSVNCRYFRTCKAKFTKSAVTQQKFNVFLVQKSSNVGGSKYLWNFGDGFTSTLRNPTHQYSSFGKYQVCIEVTSGDCYSKFCDSVGFDSTGKLLKASAWGLQVVDQEPKGNIDFIKSELKIWPNPANTNLYLDLNALAGNNFKLEISSSSGQVCTVNSFNAEKDLIDINIEMLSKGLYFIKLIGDQGVFCTKLIKN